MCDWITIRSNSNEIEGKLHLLTNQSLSVIIKLAILGNKPVGTKILIQNNVQVIGLKRVG